VTARSSGRRPLLRWALRLVRREWRQQLLVLALLTITVGGAVAGSAVAVAAASDSTGQYGDAQALVRLDGADPDLARSGIAAARQRFGTIDVIAHQAVSVPGSIQPLDVRDQDPQGPYGRPMLAVRQGRYPVGAGEVALTRKIATGLNAGIGSTVTLGGQQASVVGIVENPAELSDDFALVAPGTLPAPTSYTLLVDPGGPGGSVPDGVPSQVDFRLYGGGSDKAGVTAIVLAAVTLAMALVGLVAAAGFVVVAQRRQRQLGLLSAIGATEDRVRLVMVAHGVVIGLVAAIVGTAIGIGGWLLAAPAVESGANHRIDRLDLPWTLIVVVITLAVVAATGAAWWPARTAARLPVTAALSGRPVRPHPVHRSLLAAVALVVGGVVAITLARPRTVHVQPILLIAGVLAVVIGVVFAAPAAVRVLGRVAGRLPFAPRLALRDLARYRARAAAALAAITLGLGIAVGVVVVASASQYENGPGNLSDRELLVQVGDPRTAPNPDLTAAQQAQLDQRAATVVAALGPSSTAVPLDVVFDPTTPTDAQGREPIALGLLRDAHTLELVANPYVATPEVLARYGIDPAFVVDTTDLLTTRTDGQLRLTDFTRPSLDAPPPPTQHVDLPPYTSAPNSLLTEAAVRRHGWVSARAAWIVESPHPLTAAQVKAARAVAADAGLAVEVRSHHDALSALRTGATLVGALLAAAIVAMAVGLIRGESARELRTLTATGASARTRRALTATSAAALAVMGVLLGTSGAYVALIAAFRSDLGPLVPIPVSHLLSLAIGLPAAAAAGGWLLAGREPRSFARQALE
jgi:putative ABC transport system permease protein